MSACNEKQRKNTPWPKRAAESQPRPSGPADNEEDREDVEILSPSQPATSTQPEQNLDLTRDSEESQDEEDNDIWDSSDRTMVTFSSFLPVLILSCTNILAFRQILYLYINLMSCIFLFSVPAVLVTFFFFLSIRFGVLLWQPGFESWFQFGDWFFGSGSSVASGTENIFPALLTMHNSETTITLCCCCYYYYYYCCCCCCFHSCDCCHHHHYCFCCCCCFCYL